jgi:hypothetical protein
LVDQALIRVTFLPTDPRCPMALACDSGGRSTS